MHRILLLSLVPLLGLGCAANSETLPETTVTRIGLAGGPATSADGDLTLTFPERALGADTDISIHTDRSSISSAFPTPIYELGPDLDFAQPVTLRLNVAQAAAGERFALVSVGQSSPVEIAGYTYEAATHLLTAHITRSSKVRAERTDQHCTSNDDCAAYPGSACINGQCINSGGTDRSVDAGPGPGDLCTTNADCAAFPGSACTDHHCINPGGPDQPVDAGTASCTRTCGGNSAGSCSCAATCRGHRYEVSCASGSCVCTTDAQQTGTTTSNCSGSSAAESAYQSCGFPI